MAQARGTRKKRSSDDAKADRKEVYNRIYTKSKAKADARKSVKPAYNGHAAQGSGDSGGNSQRGRYIPKNNKIPERNLREQRAKYGVKAGSGGHEPASATNARKRSSGVRDMSKGLTAGDFRRAGQELQRGARSIAKGVENTGRKIERNVRKNWKSSNVSNKRPMDAEVNPEGSKEWKKHKYIDKVRTKSGKIRYIYRTPTKGERAENAKRVTDARTKNLEAAMRQEKERKSIGGRARSAKNKARSFIRNLFG